MFSCSNHLKQIKVKDLHVVYSQGELIQQVRSKQGSFPSSLDVPQNRKVFFSELLKKQIAQ